jgi:maleate isomerase
MNAELHRVGLIVPSSNTTMETEIPEMLRRREQIDPAATFTFHSSRVRMRQVTKEELTQMVSASERCAAELADARVDAIAYACLVAVMSQGAGEHERIERKLGAAAAAEDCHAPVVSSAGALVRAIQAMGVSRVAMVAPYMKPLTRLVADYMGAAGVDVVDVISLEIPDNLEVAAHDPMRLPDIAGQLDLADAEAVVLSACVQMRSLPAVPVVEEALGLPVLSASIATTYEILDRLGLEPVVPGAGTLLSGGIGATVGLEG